jgi:tetratricopeptide (TPR) repeat protein
MAQRKAPAAPAPAARGSYLRWAPLVLVVVAGLGVLARDLFRTRIDPVAPPDWNRVDATVLPVLRQAFDTATAQPGSARAHGRLAMVYEANGFWDEAARAFAIAGRLDGDEPAYTLHRGISQAELGRTSEAEKSFARAEESSTTRAAAAHRRGWLALSEGRAEEALAAFERAAAAAPERPEPVVGQAAARLRLREPDVARELLEGVLADEQGDEHTHYLLGTAYRDLGRDEDARRELALGAGGSPAFVPDVLTAELAGVRADTATRVDRALAMIREGRAEDGLRVLEQLYGESPADVDSINNLAVARLEAGQPERALADLQRALALREDAFQTWLNLGACQIALRRLDDALRSADRAARLAPDLGAPQLLRGRVLVLLGRAAEALGPLERAVRLDPDNADARFLFGELLASAQRYGEAATEFEAAARLRPDHLMSQVKLCRVAVELGRFDQARAAFAAARRIAPASPAVALIEQLLAERGGG